MDRIEFYRVGSAFPFASVESSMVPLVGAKINIINGMWKVVTVTYVLDEVATPSMRAIVTVK